MSERVCQVSISLVLLLRHTHNKIKIDRQKNKVYVLCVLGTRRARWTYSYEI